MVQNGFHSPWDPAPPPLPPRRRPPYRSIALFCAAALIGLLAWDWTPRLNEPVEQAYFLRGGIILLISLAAIGSRRRLSGIAADLGIWAGVLTVLLAGYAYRFELQEVGNRVLSELIPSRPELRPDGSVSLRRALSGSYEADAQVNGVNIRFLVDTGASDIVLTTADAARLGIDPSRLRFTRYYQTANGVTRGAPIRLRSFRIGPLAFTDLDASVNEGDLSTSLLGMGLLERLSSVEIRNNRLILRR